MMQRAGEMELGALREPLAAVAAAIADYCAEVLATADPEDPATAEAAKKALKPIDVIRGRTTRTISTAPLARCGRPRLRVGRRGGSALPEADFWVVAFRAAEPGWLPC